MTRCFLKLYTPTRVCEIIIRNWSAGQLVSPKKPDSIRRNGRKKKEKRRLSDGTMDERKAGIQCRGMDIRKPHPTSPWRGGDRK